MTTIAIEPARQPEIEGLLRAGEAPRWAVEHMGTALGFDAGLEFDRTEIEFRPGDALLLYTDGVTEAFDVNDECYGGDRYASGARQSDDIAILTMRAGTLAAEPHVETHELQATPAEIMRGVEAVRAFGRKHDVPEKAMFGLALAVEECGTNLMKHAFGNDASQRFRLVVQRRAGDISVELRDRGLYFDPTQVPVAALDAGGDSMHEGGMGLHLVRHYIDDVTYAAEGDEHVLRLTRRL